MSFLDDYNKIRGISVYFVIYILDWGGLFFHMVKRSCDFSFLADQSFLVFVRRNEIRGVDLENANFSVIPTLTTPYVNNPIAVDYDISDENEGHLYWADQDLKVINKSPLSGANVQTVIDSGKQCFDINFKFIQFFKGNVNL